MNKQIMIGQRISIEGIFLEEKREILPRKLRDLVIESERVYENEYFTFYNTKNNVMARYCDTMVWTLRDYEMLFEEVLKGNLKAKEKLIKNLEIQEKRLTQIGRNPKPTSQELINSLQSNSFDKDILLRNLENLFSLVDLDESIS